jgi:hypothetical protein
VSDDTDDVSWLRSLLERSRPAPGPASGRWALGVGDMVADHSLTPGKLRGLVRKLNYFGGVAISEDAVEFDGDKVEWADVEEVRTRSLIEYMFTGGMESQIGRLPVPWFPFRRKVLGAISRAALTLLLAAAKQQLEGGAMEIRIPAEVHYRGMLRSRELAPGMLAALILADPAVRACFESTAQAHGVTVCPADDDVMDDADDRAEQLKSMLAKLQRFVERQPG